MRRDGTDYGAHVFSVDRILEQPEPLEWLGLADGAGHIRSLRLGFWTHILPFDMILA
jgi:hypothetical protein